MKPLDDIEIKDGSEVDCHVRCNGIPKPDIKWYRDGQELNEGANDGVVVTIQKEGQVCTSLNVEKFTGKYAGEVRSGCSNSVYSDLVKTTQEGIHF